MWDKYHQMWRVARAHTRGADVIILDLEDSIPQSEKETARASLRRSRALGFGCAACIHPAQVAVVNEEYGPAPAEVERARRLIAAFDVALAEGKGAVAFEGAMIDLPVVERARRLLARAR